MADQAGGSVSMGAWPTRGTSAYAIRGATWRIFAAIVSSTRSEAGTAA